MPVGEFTLHSLEIHVTPGSLLSFSVTACLCVPYLQLKGSRPKKTPAFRER